MGLNLMSQAIGSSCFSVDVHSSATALMLPSFLGCNLIYGAKGNCYFFLVKYIAMVNCGTFRLPL